MKTPEDFTGYISSKILKKDTIGNNVKEVLIDAFSKAQDAAREECASLCDKHADNMDNPKLWMKLLGMHKRVDFALCTRNLAKAMRKLKVGAR